MNRPLKLTVMVLAGTVVVIQLIPVARTNPPVQQDIATSDEVKGIVRRAR